MPIKRMVEITVTPTITASSAYSTGNALGGLLTFKAPGMSDQMTLTKVVILDLSKQSIATDLLLFNQTFTATTDKSAVAISAADLANMEAAISVVAGDYVTVQTGRSIATHAFSGGGVDIRSSDPGMAIYGQLVTRGTPTYGTTADITVKLTFQVWVE